MNPSASGWIKKLLNILSADPALLDWTQAEFYCGLKDGGFLYGSNIDVVKQIVDKKGLTDEELGKLNLFLALYFIHDQPEQQSDTVESIIGFYKQIKVHKTTFFGKLLAGSSSTSALEKVIHKRVQIDDNFLTKNFNYFVINALLFVDVLAYQKHLISGYVSDDYIRTLEGSIETIVLRALNAKTHKTTHDESLIRLVESSMRYQDHAQMTYDQAIKNLKSQHEKWYILDIACMATWSDKTIESIEHDFLNELGNDLGLNQEIIDRSIQSVNSFYTKYKDHIKLIGSGNIVMNFYDNSSKMVSKLISRNKKRLQKELTQSKHLMYLIGQSTIRDLTDDEQKQVQNQLIDVFKSIPSLAIFMLPGGMLLLPLVVKIIPKLLPSAFDDNRIEDS